MLRLFSISLAASFVGATSALAQSHPPTHGQARPHGADHVRPASGQHHELHARLHGGWHGTLGSSQAASHAIGFAISTDSLQRVVVMVQADRALQLGAASDLVVKGDAVQWTQLRSGVPCKATAVLGTSTRGAPDTLTGVLACGSEQVPFALRKRSA